MNPGIIQPPFLKTGDTVAIISTSGVIDREKTDAAITVLEAWGLKVITGRNAFNRYGPFAGTDDERLADLQWAADNKELKAVFCSRGGYGITRIIDKVNFSGVKKRPKWFIGFSDITVLHQWLLNVCGIMSVHGEMPLNFGDAEKSANSFDSLRRILFGEGYRYTWKSGTLANGRAQGVITGGNLSLLCSLTGTVAAGEMKGKILFIEDVGEYYYHLDRLIVSLRLAGRLKDLAGLLVGGLTRMEEGRIPWGRSAEAIVSDVVSCYDYPVFFGFPSGHVTDNQAFIIGKEVIISSDGEEQSLIYA